MSIAASGPADFGQMASLISDSAAVKQKLDQLTTQISTGLVSNTYAGLGSGAAVSLNLQPQIAALQTWQNNINQAASGMQVTQTAMTQIQQIASNFLAADRQPGRLRRLGSGQRRRHGTTGAGAGRRTARYDRTAIRTYSQVRTATNPPVPDPDSILSSGILYPDRRAGRPARHPGRSGDRRQHAGDRRFQRARPLALLGLSVAAGGGIAQTPTIQIGQGQTASVGLLASANSRGDFDRHLDHRFVYARPDARAGDDRLAEQLRKSSDSGFQALVQDTNASLTGAISAMAEDVGVLGNTQTNLTTTQTTLSDTATALTTQARRRAGRGCGGSHVEPVAGANPASGLLSGDCRDERAVPGEILAGELMQTAFGFTGC